MSERVSVFVLGHRGMLGHVTARYLADTGCEILTSDERYTGSPRDPLVERVRSSPAVWVVNAIGRIKQKAADRGALTLANALLPVHLAARLAPGQRLLHASTDCVFDGTTGGYRTGDEPNADDEYGFSKLLGERVAAAERCRVFRVSIIGPELGGGHGLLGWFFRQSGPVTGYTNHLWNGITTLEWAKRAADLVLGRWVPAAPLVQLAAADRVSKCDLLQTASAVWGRTDVDVRPTSPGVAIDRTLVGDVVCPPIGHQLAELRRWYEPRFGPILMGEGR